MIAFKEILDDQLPIGGGWVAARMGNARVHNAMIIKDRPHIAKGRIKIVRFILAYIDENQPVKYADMASEKAVF